MFLDLHQSYITTIPNALTHSEILDFKELLATPMHQPTTTMFGHRPKFYDCTFDAGDQATVPNRGYYHKPMTEVVQNFALLLKEKIGGAPLQFFNANIVHYAPELARSGGRGKHADNPGANLKLVIIYSMGQTRHLKIYLDNRVVQTVTMSDNSITAMVGPMFQQTFKHAVSKLPPTITPLDRYSFNARFY